MLTFRRMCLIFLMISLSSGTVMVGFCQEAGAKEREVRQGEFMDSRHEHNRSYPARGQYIDALPSGHRMVVFGKARYYFFDGVWYLPKGRRFLIVAPPIGLAISFLPPYYTTIMVGGVPYYYANEVYYTAAPAAMWSLNPQPVKSARYRLRRQCLRRVLPRYRPPEVKCQAARCRESRCLPI